MILKIDNMDYKVHFRYEPRRILSEHRLDGDKFKTIYDTICLIHSAIMPCSSIKPCSTAKMTGIFGMATQHPNDQFCRTIGRKLAFGRALKKIERASRGKFWDAYFDIVGY